MKQVANYRSGGHRIPSCKLSVKWVKPEELQPLDLCHRVNMQGAKEPYNYITIEADPQPKGICSNFHVTYCLICYCSTYHQVIGMALPKQQMMFCYSKNAFIYALLVIITLSRN